ncbi:MAG: hypothetical protein HY895_00625 [Deltaproteobacteria bacterium]|nr:hypothetical protein [Deltaproteobacteria bacterium]
MPEQLNLFQGSDTPGPGSPGEVPQPDLDEGTGALDELFRLSARWRGRREFLELLEFIARFPAYSPFNGFLIYLQNPAATHVATGRTWSRKYRRRLKPGARPILILAPMSPVLFVFDLKDTEGYPVAGGALRPPETRDRLSSRIYDATLHNSRIQHIAVREVPTLNSAAERVVRITASVRKNYASLELEATTRYLVLVDAGLSLEEKYACLVLELGRIFCGHLGIDSDAWWVDRKDLDLNRIDLEADAAAFIVCRRRGLAPVSRQRFSDGRDQDRELPPISLNAVFQAASYIEDMGKTLWRKPRKQSRY